jgi:metal-responsive CopG/Arc/MetJ family transcriptional regulator
MAQDTKLQTTVSLVVEAELLPKIDKRAKTLDLNRSQYFRRLARLDLQRAKEEKRAA